MDYPRLSKLTNAQFKEIDRALENSRVDQLLACIWRRRAWEEDAKRVRWPRFQIGVDLAAESAQ